MSSPLVPTRDPAITVDIPLVDSNRTQIVDQRLTTNLEKTQLSNRLFVRFVAKGRMFTRVDFKYSIFETCYLRDCVFDSCDFTGCRFIATNLIGATFVGCKFEYSIFERTLIDEEILDSNCPGHENLKQKFARSLRVNFQQIGNVDGVNKAVRIELEATEIHLRKAWKSNEAYYRKKYVGLTRVKTFLEWARFKLLDFLWGNGESLPKLVRSLMVALLIMTLIDVFKFHDPLSILDFIRSLRMMPEVFLGLTEPTGYSGLYLAGIATTRLISVALFVSVLVKRLNRR